MNQSFFDSLPPEIRAEASLLRERHESAHRRAQEEAERRLAESEALARQRNSRSTGVSSGVSAAAAREKREKEKKKSAGYMKCEKDRDCLIPVESRHIVRLLQFQYFLNPLAPASLLNKVFLNLSSSAKYRKLVIDRLVRIINLWLN